MFQAIRYKIILSVVALSGLSGCGAKTASFSLLAENEQFAQAVATNNKVDIIWMVDGSATMATHQDNLANNFDTFISSFAAKGFDFHMAVASTDAWIRETNYNSGGCRVNPSLALDPNGIYTSSADCKATAAKRRELTEFRDGDIFGPVGSAGVRSGVYLLTSLMTPQNLLSTFSTNIKVGVRGDGVRESAIQSLRAVLRRNSDGTIAYDGETHTVLNQFRRDDAFLAVIIVSDENDQGRKQGGTAYATDQEYVDGFIEFLDKYTGGYEGNRNYNVSSIVVDDIASCSVQLQSEAAQGDRYVAISQATNGVVGNICSSDFSSDLEQVAKRIVSLSTRFPLSREPQLDSISIAVNGVAISSDPENGWTYVRDGGSHYIEFHGEAVPPQGAAISVNYDPTTLK